MTAENSQLESRINKYELYSKVDLSFQQLTDGDMHIVVEQAIIQKQCKALLLNDNLITAEGAAIIAKALYDNTTLEELNLWNNTISDAGICSLSQALANNSTLQNLGLGQNQISDVGAQYLADMLKTNRKIFRLWLFYNQIGDHGVKSLADVLIHDNQSLQWLDLRLNKSMTDCCFDSIRNILEQNQSLSKLWMEYCNLSRPIKVKIREIGQAKKDFEIGA